MPFIYETFAQRKISAEANAMTEYVLGLRGIVPNYGSQFLLQSVGTVLKVGTGMLVFTGRKGINTELLELDIVPETLGTKTKYIIVTLDGTQQPTLASASITVSDASEGSITSKTEDLMADVQGIVKFDLGTFTNTTSGIDSNSLTITCPIIEQEIIDNIKDDVFGLQGDLSDLRDEFDNYLPLSGGTMTGTINALNINSTGVTTLNVPNFNGFVQKNTANAWATDAQFMKVLYANGNDQFKMGKDTTNPTFSQQKGFLNWYAGDGTLLISLRPGTSSDHGVVHGTQYGSYKLAYVNTSLNSASLQLNTTLQSNELTLQNIETQQNMVFSTPTIDYETINELEVQKQKILEQNAAIEDELNNIDRELEELEKLRKETI